MEPAVVEQYHYREVTDASTAALAGAFAALARVTGDAVAREKARTLGEACVRMQRPNGRIPTLWSKPSADDIQEDWINCMAATLSVLDDIAEAE